MTNAEMLEELWNEHRLSIARYIGRRIQDSYLIEELTAVTYARAWVAMCNGNGYDTKAVAWLYTIAKNVMRDYWRNWQNRTWFVEFDAEPEMDDNGTKTDLATERLLMADEGIEDRCIVRVEVPRAMKRLTAQQRTVINYRLQGYQHDEIGQMIGNTLEGTKQLARRAEARLREILKEAA